MNVKNISVCNRKIILLFFVFFFTNSYSQYVFNSKELPRKISLLDYTSIADVGQKELNIHYVLNNFKSFKLVELKEHSNYLGFTENHFWTMTNLVNNTDSELNYYFETARPVTDLVELYIVDEKTGKIEKEVTGDAMGYKERSLPNRRSLFYLKIQPRAHLKFIMHVKSDGEVVKLPLNLYSPENFLNYISNEQFVFGLFYGLLTIVTIIYFFFFIALKEVTFLYYSLYVVSVGLLQFALDGYFYQYVTPGGGWFSNHAVLLLAIIGALLAGKYGEVFFKVKDHSASIYNFFKVNYAILLLLLLCVLFVPAALPYCYVFINVFSLFFLMFIVFMIGYFYYKKKPVDSFYTIGIFFLIIGFGVFILDNVGVIKNTFLTQNSSKIGTGLEVVFLSLSMSNLIRKLKNEKNDLNKIALVKSEEMNELKSYFFQILAMNYAHH